MTHYHTAIEVINTLKQAGFIAYIAGGWVRDFLMSHPSDDIDIATNASVAEIVTLFPKTIPVGIHFGIVIVVHKEHHFEVATFRREEGYKDGRRPTLVHPASPEVDAMRRDFTINGMFFDPIQERLYDFVGGRKDLSQKIIRSIGKAEERFDEDRLRMVRAVRYASRFNFQIEEKTKDAILNHAHTLLPAVAIERIWNELEKMALFSSFGKALVTLQELKLLPVIFPTLQALSPEIIEKRVSLLSSFPKEAPLISQILELFPHATLKEKQELCIYLKLSKKDLHYVQFYERAKELLIHPSKVRPSEWAHFYAHPLSSLTLEIFALHLPSDRKESFLKEQQKRKRELHLPIEKIQKGIPFLTSEDLRQKGVPNGPEMGRLLKEGEEIAINQGLDSPSEILKQLRL